MIRLAKYASCSAIAGCYISRKDPIPDCFRSIFLSRKERIVRELECAKKRDYSEFLHRLSEIQPEEVPDSYKPLRGTIEKIGILLQERKSDPFEEKKRLENNPRVRSSFEKCSRFFRFFSYFPSVIHENAFKQAIELQDTLGKDYYVFTHAASNHWLPLHILTKKIDECLRSRQYRFFEPLRDEIFLQKISDERDVEYYKQELGRQGANDGIFHVDLLSCDVWLENRAWMESALNVFVNGRSVKESESLDYALFGRVNTRFAKKYSEQIVNERIGYSYHTENLHRYIRDRIDALEGATLYTICVPKKRFSEIGYPCEAFGTPVTREENFLEDLQAGNIERTRTQVRLLVKKMTPENGVFIIKHSTLPERDLQEMETKIDNFVRFAVHHARVDEILNERGERSRKRDFSASDLFFFV